MSRNRAIQFLSVSLVSVTCIAEGLSFNNRIVKNSESPFYTVSFTQEATSELFAGMKLERALSASDNHTYTIQLEKGAAVIADLEQQGIDLSIDVYDPDGLRVMRLDGENDTQGSETIDFTALRSGTHKFGIHATDTNARPGKYVITVSQILTPLANARRLAKEQYPTQALYDLWEKSLTDPLVVERFVSERKKSGPIIEALPGNTIEHQVTYFCLGDQDTESVELVGGPDFLGLKMSRLGQTNLFFTTQIVPNDARFIYAFNLYKLHRTGLNGAVEVRETLHTDDSLIEMPLAPKQPYIVARKSAPKGKTVQKTVKSVVLKEERKITVYTPADYDGKTGCNLLIVFDGVTYGGLPDGVQAEVPTPTILDNLIAEKKIAPTVAILVWPMGKRNRDLTGSKPFSDFIAGELVPWARLNYNILPGPRHVVTAGSSLGGHCATYCAFTHSETIGNVISQSGSYWISKSWQTVDAQFHRRLYPRDTGNLIEAFKSNKRLPIRFYMEVGIYDMGAALLGSNRELRDVLQLKGYDVAYSEFAGGHSSVNWRGSFAGGLISMLGRKRK